MLCHLCQNIRSILQEFRGRGMAYAVLYGIQEAIPMTTRTYTLLAPTLGALAFALAAACGGSFDGGSGTQGVKPGGACSGTSKAPADDGCNTCECMNGKWGCSNMACPVADGGGVACTPGASRPADDGCNTCVCSENGGWSCTLEACPPPTCIEGETSNDGCNSCTCSGGGWMCTNRACPPPPPPPPPPPVCVEGETKMMDCNTCTCMGGKWGCTTMACPPPACVDGQSTYDGCNSCSCFSGQWACTARYCPPPPPPVDAGPAVDAGPPSKGCGGWLGNTCTQDEYCAYQEGAMCGAADASAFCAPRPGACDTVYAPVCGCDMKTYGNACEAAMAGTGVMYNKVCPTIAVP
jgi:hypothetical protein